MDCPVRLQNFLEISIPSLCLLLCGCSGQSDLLDAEMQRLCAIDGGIRVYELARRDATRREGAGWLEVPGKTSAGSDDDYHVESEIDYPVKGTSQIVRTHLHLVRRSDWKIVAEAISYSRRPGGLTIPWVSPPVICPVDSDLAALTQRVFRSQ